MSTKLTCEGFVLHNMPNFALNDFSPILYLLLSHLPVSAAKTFPAVPSSILRRKPQNNLSRQINKTKPGYPNSVFSKHGRFESMLLFLKFLITMPFIPGCFNILVASLRGQGGPHNNNNAKRRKDSIHHSL